MKMKKEFNLKKSEIKKAEAFANKHLGKTDCKVTGWFTNGKIDDVTGFMKVKCEICSNNMNDREECDVDLSICTWDRRRSYAFFCYEY